MRRAAIAVYFLILFLALPSHALKNRHHEVHPNQTFKKSMPEDRRDTQKQQIEKNRAPASVSPVHYDPKTIGPKAGPSLRTKILFSILVGIFCLSSATFIAILKPQWLPEATANFQRGALRPKSKRRKIVVATSGVAKVPNIKPENVRNVEPVKVLKTNEPAVLKQETTLWDLNNPSENTGTFS